MESKNQLSSFLHKHIEPGKAEDSEKRIKKVSLGRVYIPSYTSINKGNHHHYKHKSQSKK